MLWKISLVLLGLWCALYTASYAVFEYKRKNPLGSAVVFALCALILFAVPGIVF